jgi:hypothetical protein
MKKEKDWFKLKRYPHIGFPLEAKDRFVWIEKYVTSPELVAKHGFLPFIHKTYSQRKFRKKYNEHNGEIIKEACNIQNKKHKALRYPDKKNREIYYAGHLDALIYSYYSDILNDKYNSKLISLGLNESITAYRSIPKNESIIDGPNKCNIDFANDVFKEILNRIDDEFVVMAFDISSFFDNLDHKILLKIWVELMDVDKLPEDHFNVFKNITRFSYVDQVEIFEMFKKQIWVERYKPFTNKTTRVQKEIPKIKFLRNQKTLAFCDSKTFFKHRKKLVHELKHKNPEYQGQKRNYGIPQGSPISSILANLYLLHFDKTINDFVKKFGGVFRRYSDDMVVICNSAKKVKLENLVYNEIEKYKLEIQKKKTQIFHFKRENEGLTCGQEFPEKINWNKNFIYLGFEFDGQSVFLKSASLSGYYRKMKRTIRRGKHFTNKAGSKTKGEFFKSRILKKYSYKGAKRRRKFIWNEKEKKFKQSDKFNWGNFLSYAYKAEKTMLSNKIKSQTRRHWRKIEQLIKD